MVDQVLFDDPTPTPRRTGIGTLIDISDSHCRFFPLRILMDWWPR